MRASTILIMLLFSSQMSIAQSFTKPKYELGVGYVIKHKEGFGIPRATFAVNDFLTLKGFGFVGAYTTIEYRSGINFKEDGTNYFYRMPVGLSYSLPKLPDFQLFGGGDVLNFAGGKNLRKELGIRYLHKNIYSIRVGYSTWVGATLGFGYQIPSIKASGTGKKSKPTGDKNSN